jgi:hypothetical protein
MKQGWNHKERVAELCEVVAEEAQREFREDSRPSLRAFLKECLSTGFEHAWPPEAKTTQDIEDIFDHIAIQVEADRAPKPMKLTTSMWDK